MIRSYDNLNTSFRVAQERFECKTSLATYEAALVSKKRTQNTLNREWICTEHGEDDADVGLNSRSHTAAHR